MDWNLVGHLALGILGGIAIGRFLWSGSPLALIASGTWFAMWWWMVLT